MKQGEAIQRHVIASKAKQSRGFCFGGLTGLPRPSAWWSYW